MNASFVIVNYNRKDELLITLEKTRALIKDSPVNYEIVVVDNGSTDGSAIAVSENFPEVVLIASPLNTGAPAWNDGFAKATGDYFIILDDDSHIESGLNEALYYMEARPVIGVLALNILTGPYTSAAWDMVEDKNIVGFIGCGAILRRTTYEKIGGYADWIFLYVNEWDLGMRCTNAGYTVQFFKDCKVIHRTSAVNRTTKRLDMLVAKHELGIIYKHFRNNKWKYITRVTLNNLKRMLWAREFNRAWYTLLGVNHFLKMRSAMKLTPVSKEAQQAYVEAFPAARKSIFSFVTDRLHRR
jgi:GT2 family glycosyltransferase